MENNNNTGWIGIEIHDPGVISELDKLGFSWWDKKDYHITVRYIQNVLDEDFLLEKIWNISKNIKPFNANLSETGFFDNEDGVVFWCGINSDYIYPLYNHVDSVVRGLGYPPPDYDPYKPHVTVSHLSAVDKVLFTGKMIPYPYEWTVRSLSYKFGNGYEGEFDFLGK